MIHRPTQLLAMVAVGTLAAAGCSDQLTTGVQPAPDASPRGQVAEMCEVVTFDQFGHGDAINSVSLPTLGLNLTVSVNRFANDFGMFGGAVAARAFETDGLDDNPAGPGSVVVEDDDLQWRGEENTFGGESDGGGECAGCAGLGRLLVIPDERAFVPWGDYRWGGTVTLTGNFSSGDYYLASFVAVDVDTNSPGIRAFADATQVAQSAPTGNGSVQTVATTSQPAIGSSLSFVLGTAATDNTLGSGAIDGIRICQRQTLGEDGCTPGYWKNHTESWAGTGLTPGQTVGSVFSGASAFPALASSTLLDALGFGGGSGTTGGAQILLRAAVAALLNASHADVDYPRTAASVIADVNAALASNSRSTMLELAAELDADNNLGCPLN
ncbi:MAG TPA: hypothetical protein VFQ76_13160 [Longimicrobiaceae bacterium]|nr:hypothetical protein [Longimicrobiaceae bacterium]